MEQAAGARPLEVVQVVHGLGPGGGGEREVRAARDVCSWEQCDSQPGRDPLKLCRQYTVST